MQDSTILPPPNFPSKDEAQLTCLLKEEGILFLQEGAYGVIWWDSELDLLEVQYLNWNIEGIPEAQRDTYVDTLRMNAAFSTIAWTEENQ